jgi:hypothetical protein
VEHAFTARRIALTLAAVVATILAGTISFRHTLDEAWGDSFYRAVIAGTRR